METAIRSLAFGIVIVPVVVLLWRRLVRVLDEANGTDWGGPWLNRLDGLNRIFCRRYHRFVYDPLPLPEQGGAIVVSNHVSGLDPLLLIAAANRPLRFMIAREQYERFGLRWLFRAVGCIPVDRGNRPDRALREARRALEQGEVVALFPHGAIHIADKHPPRRLKGGAVRLAHQTGCPIVPARLEGVSGQGLVVSAVVLRSRARLVGFAPLQCDGKQTDECLETLAFLLSRVRSAEEVK